MISKGSDWDPIETQKEVRRYASRGFEALRREGGEEAFNRVKLAGLYPQRQTGYFMFRTRVPGGILKPGQARAIGELADRYARAPDDEAGGFVDITTRQDVQMHWIKIENLPRLWDHYEAVGLTTLQACGNSVRNITSCPIAGLDREELIDTRPIVREITDYFTGNRRYANLPRKFKVSLTGCRENCAKAEINDIGFTPAVQGGTVGFNVRVGGGLSDSPRMASDLDLFVHLEQVLPLIRACVQLFTDRGNYLNMAANRLRILVGKWSPRWFRDELKRYAGFAFEPAGENRIDRQRLDHMGVHRQKQAGLNYVGLNVPVGRIPGEDLVEIDRIARKYGNGEIRLTSDQNLIIPNVPDDRLEQLLDEPLLESYCPDPKPFARGVVVCPGSEFCNFGIIETKNRAKRWAEYLDEHLDLGSEVIRLHLSGCKASCAQPQIADVGLRGAIHRTMTGSVEAVDVGLGGSLGRDARFIRWVKGSSPAEEIPEALKRLVEQYIESRRPGERFYQFCRRTSIDRLKGILNGRDDPE
ncbi:MAG: nitrite/sulfite reductase [Candidatus Bipolaricaulia bacterium]